MSTLWKIHLSGLLFFLLVVTSSAKIDSVLEIIPDSAIGLVHIGDLKGFNQEVSNLIAEMDPSADPETDVIAKILADMFSAGFESLDEVEEIGFDLLTGYFEISIFI